VEPPHAYLREPSASVVHHADYLNARDDTALCGVALQNPNTVTTAATSDALCPDCQAKIIVYHLQWWRQKAEAATAELEELRVKYRELQEPAGTQRLATATAEVDEDSSEEAHPDHAPEAGSTAFLDQAQQELTELCLQFDGAVPYFRLKRVMQAFSDRLDTRQRVLLAEEIGTDGSLIRWATTRVETLGWQVTNSPVQENSDRMWEEWLEESRQAPKKTKRRFGRSRSHGDG
jgi:hypothetical protein